MTLSADKLNLRSPYRLAQINDMTFSFVTDKQIHYNVGFYKDTYFMDDGAYHFFIDRSGRLQGKNSEHEHGSYDPKILDRQEGREGRGIVPRPERRGREADGRDRRGEGV